MQIANIFNSIQPELIQLKMNPRLEKEKNEGSIKEQLRAEERGNIEEEETVGLLEQLL